MPQRDPIRLITRRKLKAADMNSVANAVRSDMVAMRRALKQRFGDDFVESEFEIPSKEMAIGFASNVRAWLFNESRRTKETILDLTSGGANKAQVLQWIRGLEFNKGILAQSVSAHPRAARRAGTFEFAQASGIRDLLMAVPRAKESSIKPSGILQRYVGRVMTISRWQQISKALNKDRSGLSLIFTLGLHHNDPHQMVPVTRLSLSAAVAAASKYRARLLNSIRRRGN